MCHCRTLGRLAMVFLTALSFFRAASCFPCIPRHLVVPARDLAATNTNLNASVSPAVLSAKFLPPISQPVVVPGIGPLHPKFIMNELVLGFRYQCRVMIWAVAGAILGHFIQKSVVSRLPKDSFVRLGSRSTPPLPQTANYLKSKLSPKPNQPNPPWWMGLLALPVIDEVVYRGIGIGLEKMGFLFWLWISNRLCRVSMYSIYGLVLGTLVLSVLYHWKKLAAKGWRLWFWEAYEWGPAMLPLWVLADVEGFNGLGALLLQARLLSSMQYGMANLPMAKIPLPMAGTVLRKALGRFFSSFLVFGRLMANRRNLWAPIGAHVATRLVLDPILINIQSTMNRPNQISTERFRPPSISASSGSHLRWSPRKGVDQDGYFPGTYKATLNISPETLSVKIRDVPGTGSCLFHAIGLSMAHVIHGEEFRYPDHLEWLYEHSSHLRQQAVQCLSKGDNKLYLHGEEYTSAEELVWESARRYNTSPNRYLEWVVKDTYVGDEFAAWGGGPEICALCNLLERPIYVYEWGHTGQGQMKMLQVHSSFGNPKFDQNEPLRILWTNSHLPDMESGLRTDEEKCHFMVVYPHHD